MGATTGDPAPASYSRCQIRLTIPWITKKYNGRDRDRVYAAFGVTVQDIKTEKICLHTRGVLDADALFLTEAVGKVYT